jgi:signal transduction histidine kinase
MPEVGPREVRQAARAFNDMQEKLRRLIENRTRMLAAISHDLRTPITLLRLRAELIEGEEDRRKTLSTLDEMEKMIAATLAFARDDAETETRKVVDLAALVDAICTDLADAGGEVTCEAPEHLAYECAPTAMRRALTNLVDNALKYGKRATVRLAAESSHVVVTIEDEGPGIPENRLEDVFAPFVRVEESRNAETGGVGLGLSVARSVVHAHGGEISLENLDERGLRVRLILPR